MYTILILRQKAIYLLSAYNYAIQNMNVVTWEDCCNETVARLKYVGIVLFLDHQSIQRLNQMHRNTGRLHYLCTDLRNTDPPLFQMFPEIKKRILVFFHRYLVDISIERTHKELTIVIIPHYAEKHRVSKYGTDLSSKFNSIHDT